MSKWRKYVRPLGKGHEGTRRYYNRVKKSCNARGATYEVLRALIAGAEDKQNTVTMTRAQMGADAHRGIWSVKVALENLRKAGILQPVAYGAGGRHCPTTYAILPAGEGVKPDINLAEGWGQDHPYWVEISATLRQQSLSRWENIFCLLKFYHIDDGMICLVAPNAWLAEKVNSKHQAHILEASKAFGVTDVFVGW